MDPLVNGDLRIVPTGSAAELAMQLVWHGKSNDRDPLKFLSPYFSTILATAAQRKVPVEMHFEQLEHFNSSTITALIQLIQDARSRGIRLALVFDGRLKWQKLSFDALRVLSKGDGLLELRAIQGS